MAELLRFQRDEWQNDIHAKTSLCVCQLFTRRSIAAGWRLIPVA